MLKLSQADYAAIRRHGEEAYPAECCGVLVGVNTGAVRAVRATYRCGNARSDAPRTRYAIEAADVARIQREAREHGWEIVGIYHSHPDHPALWSPTDLEDAWWTRCSYLITSVTQGKAGPTMSFVLTGTREEDKALEEEEIALE